MGHFSRLDTGLFNAVAREAHADDLPFVVDTADARDVTDALAAQAASIEHGSFREEIPDSLFDEMARRGTFYDPTLSVGEAFEDFAAGKSELLQFSLVEQVGPAALLRGTEEALTSKDAEPIRQAIAQYSIDMRIASDNLRRGADVAAEVMLADPDRIEAQFFRVADLFEEVLVVLLLGTVLGVMVEQG